MKSYEIAIFVLAATFIDTAHSIRCYTCNSFNNSMCLDPTVYDRETQDRYIRTTDCNQGIYSAMKREYFCRKITQTILHKDKQPEVRVMRGCGWVKHHRACYTADNDDHLETVCQCFSDDCNASTSLTSSLLVLTTVMMGGLSRMLRFWE